MFNPLQLNCPQCGGVVQAKDSSDQGKEVRCPKCHEIFRLELPDEDVDTANFSKRSQSGPRRRSVWLTVVLALFILAAGGAVAGLFYKPRPPVPSEHLDLAWLPVESDVVACLKVADVLDSPLLTDVVSNPAASAVMGLFTSQSGISLRQLESVTVGVVAKPPVGLSLPGVAPARPRPPYAVIVIRSKTPLDAEGIAVKALKGVPHTYSGTTYFKLPVPGGQTPDSCFFPEPNTAVVAIEADLQAAIGRGANPLGLSDFDFVRNDQTLVVAVRSQILNGNAPPAPIPMGANLRTLESELKQNFRTVSLGIVISESIDLDVTINCGDEPGATQVKQALEANVSDLKTLLKKQQNVLNLSGMSDVVELAEKSLSSITVSQTGLQLEAVATIPAEFKAIIAKHTAALTPMFPGAAAPTFPGAGMMRGLPSFPAPGPGRK
jgi:phage FluMu protein Com